MNRRSEHLIQALDRVEDYLAQNQDAMQEVVNAEARQYFSASRDRMVERMKAQDAFARGARSCAITTGMLKEQLVREHMFPISVVARTRLSTVAELKVLTVSWRIQRLGSLVTAGYGMAEEARKYEQTFLTAGLPPDFIARLVAQTDALRDAMNAQSQLRAQRVKATIGLGEEARVARGALRVLDVLVRSRVKEKEVLARWRQLRRVTARATGSTRIPEQADEINSAGSSPSGTVRPEEVRAAA
jgi:hypothetical protein